MDRDIEMYIKMGRQQMDNGNYEEAENTFNLVSSLMAVLIDMCRAKKAEKAKQNCENKGHEKEKGGDTCFCVGGSKGWDENVQYYKEIKTKLPHEFKTRDTGNQMKNIQYESGYMKKEDKQKQYPAEEKDHKKSEQKVSIHDIQLEKTHKLMEEEGVSWGFKEYNEKRNIGAERKISHEHKDEEETHNERKQDRMIKESALEAKNFKKDKTFIEKSERSRLTKNARESHKILEAARKEEAQLKAVRQAEEQIAKVSKEQVDCLTNDSYIKTEEVVLTEEEEAKNETTDIKTIKEAVNVTKNLDLPRVGQSIIDKRAAEECIKIAEAALDNCAFSKAERILKKAKRLDPNINVENLQSRIRATLASRTSNQEDFLTVSGEIVFQPSENKRNNSEKCVKLSDYFLQQNNIPKAEEFLLKAREFYNSNYVKEKFDTIEKIKKESGEIVFQPSENKKDNSKTCVKISDYFLQQNNIPKAKEFLLKAREFYNSNYVKEKFDIIEKIKKESGEIVFQPSENKKDNSKTCVKISDYFLQQNNIPKAEEFLLKAREFYNSNYVKEKFDNIEKIKKESGEIVFQPSGNKKDNSKTCVKISDYFLQQNNIPKAEEFLLKAREFYNSNHVKEKFDTIEKIKKESGEIVIPIFQMSENKRNNSKQCVNISDYFLQHNNIPKAEEFLLKAREFYNSNYVKEKFDTIEKIKKESGEIVIPIFQMSENKRNNSKQCVNISDYFLQHNNIPKAEEFLLKAREFYNSNYVKEKFDTIEKIKKESGEIVSQPSENKRNNSKKCVKISDYFLQQKNIPKAEEFLLKAREFYNSHNLKEKFDNIEKTKKESGEIVFQPSENKRNNSKKCVNISDYFLQQNNIPKAEEFLLKAREFYNSNNLKEKFDNIEKIKKEKKTKASLEIPEPGFVYSNSETCFVKDPNQEIPPSYHIANDQDKVTFKEYLHTSYNFVAFSALGNKDEADKCVQIAETEFAACRLARAKRHLQKAERLCPTTRAKDLLRQIEDAISKGVKDTEEGKPRKPKQNPSENQELEVPKRSMEPTAEQVEAVRRVKEGKDDYEILGVKKDSNQTDVRKAFRRLTLLLHPDKNRAPGAREAFMLASEAAARLKKKASTNGRRTMSIPTTWIGYHISLALIRYFLEILHNVL